MLKVHKWLIFELRRLIDEIADEKLLVLVGDDEDDLALKENLKRRLYKLMEQTKDGERGEAFDDVFTRLGLN